MTAKPVPFSRPVLHRRLGDDGRFDAAFEALAADYARLRGAADFLDQLDGEIATLAQRPSPLVEAPRLTQATGGARLLFKREDQSAPGARLVTAVAGQAAIARRLGRASLVTSTVNGPRGIATAVAGARLALQAIVYMDRDDLDRHKDAVLRMKLLGAEIRDVTRRDLPERDVRIPALDHWTKDAARAFPVMGLDAGPQAASPMGADIIATIGRETLRQSQALAGRAPDLLVARGGDTADAIGWFEPFLGGKARMACVAPGRDLGIARKDEPLGGRRGPSRDALERIAQAGLAAREYAPVVREHGALRASGKVDYVEVAPAAAHKALGDTAALEGVVPSIETAHAIAWACAEAAKMKRDHVAIVMLAENADSELPELARMLEGRM